MVSFRVGDEVVLLRRIEIAPGSLLHLEAGDVGKVVTTSDTACTATFGGATVLVPLEQVQALARPRSS